MKTTIIILLMCLGTLSKAQFRSDLHEYPVEENSLLHSSLPKKQPSNIQLHLKNWNYKKSMLGFGIAFIGGAANGLNQTIVHHYPKFEAMHPNADRQFCDPSISWKNKVKDWDAGDYRERFWGSKTIFVGFTDLFHSTSQIDNACLFGSALVITFGEKRKWWEYGIDIAGTFVARSAGFHGVYSLIYK